MLLGAQPASCLGQADHQALNTLAAATSLVIHMLTVNATIGLQTLILAWFFTPDSEAQSVVLHPSFTRGSACLLG